MDLNTAKGILELPDKWDQDLLKKNYRRLAMKYHPDKLQDKDSSKFIRLCEAYEFLSGNNKSVFKRESDIINDIFKNFMGSFKMPTKMFKNIKKTITITPKQYLSGGLIETDIPDYDNQDICMCCAGGGYCMNGLDLEVCMSCLGEGIVFKNKKIKLTIPPFINIDSPIILNGVGIFKLKFEEESGYYFYNKKLFYNFDISLKESLTGFEKIFKDPFGNDNIILVHEIIIPGDGYLLKNLNLILKFNIIYPDKINSSVIEQLKLLDF